MVVNITVRVFMALFWLMALLVAVALSIGPIVGIIAFYLHYVGVI